MKKLILLSVIVLVAGNQLIKNETTNIIVSIIASLTILVSTAKLIIDKKIVLTTPKILMFSFFILLTIMLYLHYIWR